MEKGGCAFQPSKTRHARAADLGVPGVHWVSPSGGGAFLASTITIVHILADWWRLSLSHWQKNSRRRCRCVRHRILFVSSFWCHRESEFPARSVDDYAVARQCTRNFAPLRCSIEVAADDGGGDFGFGVPREARERVRYRGGIHGARHFERGDVAGAHHSNDSSVPHDCPFAGSDDIRLQYIHWPFSSRRG